MIPDKSQIYDKKLSFLKDPVDPNAPTLKLTLVRKTTGFGILFPKYYLYNEDKSVLLLNSKKMLQNQTSNYLISTERDVFRKDSYTYIGKLRKLPVNEK